MFWGKLLGERGQEFLEGLEGEQGTPSILCTGDMNLPFVTDWSKLALEKFCTKVAEQETSNRTTAEDKKQAVLLIKFAQENYGTVHQHWQQA